MCVYIIYNNNNNVYTYEKAKKIKIERTAHKWYVIKYLTDFSRYNLVAITTSVLL